jgi:hypothetical protein
VAEIRRQGPCPWAGRRLAAKNSLTVEDAGVVEATYQAVLDAIRHDAEVLPKPKSKGSGAPNVMGLQDADVAAKGGPSATYRAVLPIRKERGDGTKRVSRSWRRSLVLFAASSRNPRSLERKVSDEFTVPLCRDHHRQLHQCGNEVAWWTICRLHRSNWRKILGHGNENRRRCLARGKLQYSDRPGVVSNVGR